MSFDNSRGECTTFVYVNNKQEIIGNGIYKKSSKSQNTLYV